MQRIVVAGAGAIGANVALQLAQRGAREVVLVERGTVACGSTGKAMGGVRQQFSSAAEVRLAQESIGFLKALGPGLFDQVGYLFLASTPRGLAGLEERRALQAGLGVPVDSLDAAGVAAAAPGVAVDDVLGGVVCLADGLASPPDVTRELVRQAVELGVELREHTRAEDVEGDVHVIACGAYSPALAAVHGVTLPIRPLRRQLLATTAIPDLPLELPMVVESETGFHFRRRRDHLVIAMTDETPTWADNEECDRSVDADRLARLTRRYPPSLGAGIADGWAGLYDMTPDAHPIIGEVAEGVIAACGFSGHGFMQSPAVGRAVAELILDGESSIDLSPYRLDRFAAGATVAETVIL